MDNYHGLTLIVRTSTLTYFEHFNNNYMLTILTVTH